jgi:hypothetical protein
MPYPVTVRAGVLDKLIEVLPVVIPELQTVRKFARVPDDLMAVELPAAYLFEIAPEERSYSNRVAIAKMRLMIQIFFNITMKDSENNQFTDAQAFMEYCAGKLHGMFHNSVGLSKNGLVNVVEITYDRIISNDSIGLLNSTFDVEYRHDRGNAFQ